MASRSIRFRVHGLMNELAVLGDFAWSSRGRVATDIVLSRVTRGRGWTAADRIRTVSMNDGTLLSYRLNFGDVQAVREIWRDAVYLPPDQASQSSWFLDLGANIGFASVFMAKRTGIKHVIAVEPDADNARLLRRNLAQNHINAIVLEAAVGDRDGTATFVRSRESNLGHVGEGGDTPVELVSMATVLDHVSGDERVLMKIDIEGGERELFAGDVSWLEHVMALTMEIHPAVADSPRIHTLLTDAGFHFAVGPGGRTEPKSFWLRGEAGVNGHR
jgi:FkbM family methyltransferase